MGTIFRRKQKQRDGTWIELPTLWIQYRENGRQRRESTHSTREAVAKRMLRDREGDAEHGIPILPKLGRITFTDAASDVLTDYQVHGQRSRPEAARRIKLHLEPVFGAKLLVNIRTADVKDFVAARQAAGASNGEINRETSLLLRMFNLAVENEKLSPASVPCVPRLPEDNVRSGFFEREQFEAMSRHLSAPLRAVTTFAYLTGWRIDSEVLPLELRQVDFKAGEVRLDAGTTKNKKGRVFPFAILPELKTLLEAQRDEAKALRKRGTIVARVFTRDGAPIKDFRHAWESATKAAGCPGRIPHDFRRTAVRNLVRAGVSENVAMRLTGHLTRSVFDRYDIVSGDDLLAAVGKLATYVSQHESRPKAAGTKAGTIADSDAKPTNNSEAQESAQVAG